MITVRCTHGEGERWAGREELRPVADSRRDRTVVVFVSRHATVPVLSPEALSDAARDRWVLDREGAPGTATRSRRGTWRLRCPACGRNLQIAERELFARFDVRHFGAVQRSAGRELIRGDPGRDTTIDLAQMLHDRG